MKTISKILMATLVMAFANKSQAQSTASAGAFATIVTPISITKVANKDLNFGNVAVQTSGAGGTVELATNGTRVRTGGVTLPAVAGTVSAAQFNVTGEDNRAFTITLPTDPVVLTRTSGPETMEVTDFISDPSGTSALESGAKVINVGATLNVMLNQAPGVYQGTFSVTVNYN